MNDSVHNRDLALQNTPQLPALHRPAIMKYVDPVNIGFAHWVKTPLLGTTTGCRQRIFGYCTGLTVGCLGEELQAGKRIDLCAFERNNHGKIEGDKRIKGTDLLLTGPLCTLV